MFDKKELKNYIYDVSFAGVHVADLICINFPVKVCTVICLFLFLFYHYHDSKTKIKKGMDIFFERDIYIFIHIYY